MEILEQVLWRAENMVREWSISDKERLRGKDGEIHPKNTAFQCR